MPVIFMPVSLLCKVKKVDITVICVILQEILGLWDQ